MNVEEAKYNIQNFFSDILPKELPGYEDRPYQQIACNKILEAIEDEKTVVMEAPTGSGKTIIALLPGIELSHKGVIYATAGITLQEQLIKKDLPFIKNLYKKYFGKELSYALLKGRNNFLCIRKAVQTIADFLKLRNQETFFEPALKINELKQSRMAKDIAVWATRTRTGDKSELSFEPYSEIWNYFSSMSDECHKKACKYYNHCLYRMHKAIALGSKIVVVNYHVLIYLLHELKENKEIIICDEAHEIPEILRNAFEKTIGLNTFKRLFDDLGKLDEATNGTFSDAVDKRYAFDIINSFFNDLRNFTAPYLKANESTVTVDWGESVSIKNVIDVLTDIASYLRDIYNIEDNSYNSYDNEAQDTNAIFAMNLFVQVNDIIETLLLAKEQDDKNTVFWIEHFTRKSGEPSAKLCLKLKKVNELCQRTLLSFRYPVFMSATLSVGKNFNYIKSELGIEDSKDFLVKSAFDLENNTLWYLPKGLPDNPNTDPLFAEKFAEKILEVLQLTKGRMMISCTSHGNVKRIHGYLERHMPDLKYYIQGQISKSQIIRNFKANQGKNSVIIGSKSFFTGIDIQGKALSCVVLDKLPFEVPTDPVMKALLRDTEKGFKHYQLGNMIILLKQIFGRLIRTKYDTGIFMIGDPRIAIGKTRYAQFIKDSFPFDATRTRSLDKLKNFWEEKCL